MDIQDQVDVMDVEELLALLSDKAHFEPWRVMISSEVRARLSCLEIAFYLAAHTRLMSDTYKVAWNDHVESSYMWEQGVPSVFFLGSDKQSDTLFILTNCHRTRTVVRFANETLRNRKFNQRRSKGEQVPEAWESGYSDYWAR